MMHEEGFYKALPPLPQVLVTSEVPPVPHRTYTSTLSLPNVPVRNYSADLDVQNGTIVTPHSPLPPLPRKTQNISPFGADLDKIEYAETNNCLKVPKILIDLREQFGEINGFQTEGVLRISANKSMISSFIEQSKSQPISQLLAQEQYKSAHLLGALIKQFFNLLPQRLLFCCDFEHMHKLGAEKVQEYIQATLPDRQKYLLVWLLEFMLEIANNHSKTRMTLENLAMISAPLLIPRSINDNLGQSMLAVGLLANVLKRMLEQEHLRRSVSGLYISSNQ